ncbi:MAG: hypothetical protein Q9209_002509 [Squamulea sp. 1 TL-2023]
MAYSLLFFLFGNFVKVAQAAPSRNLTALRTQYAPPFVPEPDGRGTWSLLYSCVFTLALCVWTAFHPNVKAPESSVAEKYLVKIKWVLVAIFAPEIGVLTAFKQYRRAKVLAANLSRLEAIAAKPKKTGTANITSADNGNAPFGVLDESNEVTSLSDRIKEQSDADPGIGDSVEDNASPTEAFSQTYGFYILMGGLTVNVSHLHDSVDRVLLTPSGLIHLAEKGYFFHISNADIEDKSKASVLAKGLVLLQITWTVLQCLSRKVTGLPLSVLEVHVLVHAGCALIMYVLWFNKPKDVDEPVDISPLIPDETIALMLIRSHRFGAQPYGNLEIPLEYYPAKLFGSKSGIWPDRRMSEAAYLMYNPHSSDGIASSEIPGSTTEKHTPQPSNGAESALTHMRSPTESKSSIRLYPGPTSSRYGVWRDTEVSGLSAHGTSKVQDVSDPARIKQQRRLRNQRPGSGKARYMITPPRREAVYTSTLRTSTDITATPDHICLGYKSEPLPGIQAVVTIGTGQFLQNGIGPTAFVTGGWRGDQVPKGTLLSDFQPALPRFRMIFARDFLSVISISRQYTTRNIQPPPDGSFLGFHNEADTIQGSYFVASSLLFNIGDSLFEEFFHSVWGEPKRTNREALLFQSIYRRLLKYEEFELGPTAAVMVLPGLLYGGLHLTLWFHDFPTYVEKLLWRISAVTLIAVPMTAAALLFVRTAYQRALQAKAASDKNTRSANGKSKTQQLLDPEVAQPSGSIVNKDAGDLRSDKEPVDGLNDKTFIDKISACCRMDLITMTIAFLCLTTLLYIFSCVFIIVESFISLRHVPIGVYTDVGWSKYIPHL